MQRNKKYNFLLINDYDKFWGAEVSFNHTFQLLRDADYNVVKLVPDKRWTYLFWGRLFNLFYFFQTFYILLSTRVDIIWVHNITKKISFSPLLAGFIFWKISFLTLHDFSLYCPKTLGIFHNNTECQRGFGISCLLYSCPSTQTGRFLFLFHFGKWLKMAINRFFAKFLVDFFFCPSLSILHHMSDSLGISKNRFFYLPNFVHEVPLKTRFLNSDLKLVFVGRISYEKWLHVLINALDILINKKGFTNIFLDIIWSGGQLVNFYKKMVHDKKLQEYVKFLWHKEGLELLHIFDKSTFLVIPSIWFENNPLVVLEAQSRWLPVIASSVGGLPELIKHGKNGFLFPMGNHLELANLVESIVNIPGYQKLSQNSYENYYENYSKACFFKRLKFFLSSIS